MAESVDIFGTVFKNGSATLLARIVGLDGAAIVPADIRMITYSIYLLDDQDPDARAVVTGHANVALRVADVIYATLQADAIWTADTLGYNFRHVIDVSSHQAFAIAGKKHLVEYELKPAVGQIILVRFRLNVI